MDNNIHIGTSGWEYKHWVGPFYPEHLASDEHLAFYCQHFQTVEINNTFYQLPTEEKLRKWYDIATKEGPENFVFAVKASRFTTHLKKLKDPEQNAGRFFERIAHLKNKLGPVLFQLPPHWHCNSERLNRFLLGLPKGYQYAFELRDETWFNDEVGEILAKHGAAFCIYEIEGRLSPMKVIGDWIYIRLHGPEETAYTGQYHDCQLQAWTKRISLWHREGKQVYCYFDNDQNGYAVQDAQRLTLVVKNTIEEAGLF